MSRLLPITTTPVREKTFRKAAGSDDSCTASLSSSSHDMRNPDDALQPMKPIHSYSDSAKVNKTVVPSVYITRGARPHRRSGIMRTRSAELVNEIKSRRAKSIKLNNKKIIEKLFGMVSSSSSITNQEQMVRASDQRRQRVQKLAAGRGRALNDTREEHRTIRLAVKAAVRDRYARRAATLLQTITRGYLIRKQHPRLLARNK